MENHELLLKETSEIVKEFYHQRNNNGELFNLYSLLGLEHRENETHSVLLADLLSPKGSHGQKDKFLQLFFEILGIKVENTEFAKVSREYYIGKIDEDYTKGGRIDILIEIGDKKWLIENKLYAKDQENQLERYHQKFPNATILYLTLDGKEYHNEIGFDVKKISYEETILKWLEKILDEIRDKEYLSNSIKQYYNLIKNVTFKGFTQEMENKISTTIKSTKDNLESAFQIYNNYENAVRKLLLENISELEVNLQEFGLKRIDNDNLSEYNCYFYTEDLALNNICIGLEFDNNLKNPFVGISLYDNSKDIDENLRKIIEENYRDFGSTRDWITFKSLPYFSSIYNLQDGITLYDRTFLENIENDFKDYSNALFTMIK